MFQKLFRKKASCEEADIANLGLHLAMTFGKNWQVSIHNRLAREYPALTQNELKGYELLCQSAIKFAHDTISSMEKECEAGASINEFTGIYAEEFPWATKTNIKALFNQGVYYSRKPLKVDV